MHSVSEEKHRLFSCCVRPHAPLCDRVADIMATREDAEAEAERTFLSVGYAPVKAEYVTGPTFNCCCHSLQTS